MQVSSANQPERARPSPLDLQEDDAFIIVKAAPRRSDKFGETVCCAGLDLLGQWVRLYPVSFRQLEDVQRFRRWDRVRYRWSKPKIVKDTRSESRRVDPNSVEIVSAVRPGERNALVARCAVTSLKQEHEAGRSLAMLRPEILDFRAVRRPADEMKEKEALLVRLRAQNDLFAPKALIPMRTCPYEFKYRFKDDDGVHEGTCQDWETEQTFLARLRDQSSERHALDWMQQKFGEEYPKKGMALAMGTHRYRLSQWLINGVVRLNDEPQMSLL